MQPETPKLLEDIRDAGEFILDQTALHTLAAYRAHRLLRQAVERNFEIIGEELTRLRRTDPAIAARLGDVRAVVAFRNVLVHGYDSVDDAIVWDVIRFHLPVLLEPVRHLLNEACE
jgi:uncharacterized protein with HEPN domain